MQTKTRMKYDYSEESVKALIDWARSAKFLKELKLGGSEKIVDLPKYVQADIYTIEQHYPDLYYNPSIDRLYRIKEKLEVAE